MYTKYIMSIIVNDFPKNAEYFRAVDGFPAYEISTDGRVRNYVA